MGVIKGAVCVQVEESHQGRGAKEQGETGVEGKS